MEMKFPRVIPHLPAGYLSDGHRELLWSVRRKACGWPSGVNFYLCRQLNWFGDERDRRPLVTALQASLGEHHVLEDAMGLRGCPSAWAEASRRIKWIDNTLAGEPAESTLEPVCKRQ